MRHPIRPLARRTAIAAVLCTLALALVPTAFGDSWGRDTRVRLRDRPLTRRSVRPSAARSTVPTPVSSTVPRLLPADNGFAWSAAALGLVTGIAAMCAVFVCVSLVRHDGRLRHA